MAEMLKDPQYLNHKFRLSEISHHYGSNVHLLDDPYLFTALAKLCRPDTHQPVINQLLNILYRELVKCVVNHEFPRQATTLESRMATFHPEGNFEAEVLDPTTQVVCVNLARAGTVPSQICFDAFNYILQPSGVRQDHISINRKVDADERVVGANLGGVKIGGAIDNVYVVVPDPMGATGSTLVSALEVYSTRGKPKKFIAIHLIVTPEYLKTVQKADSNVIVYAIRLDRGLSPADVLKTAPGKRWNEERGLNDKQYIVPGAGGLGEVINNAYV